MIPAPAPPNPAEVPESGGPADTLPVLPSLARTFRAFAIARALLGVLLLGVQSLLTLYAAAPPPLSVLLVCAVYALLALPVPLWRSPASFVEGPVSGRPPLPPGPIGRRGALRPAAWGATLGVDLLAFTWLLALSGQQANAMALFILPVLMAAVLMRRRLALAVASGVVLVLLGHAWWLSLTGADAALQLTQAGLVGAGVLAVAVLTGGLAERLARQERTTQASLELARQQALLNRLMIEEMQDGVMVVDRSGTVRAANPAALALIGLPPLAGFATFGLQSQAQWLPLYQVLQAAYATGVCHEGGEQLALELSSQGHVQRRHLRLRLRFTRWQGVDASDELCLMFVEDVRTWRARARQEQLAAMGRVSAGIAHEIRNPLAAIAQANALLEEELQAPLQQRLARMVADNVERLQRIVDDVLEVAPGVSREAPLIDLRQAIAQIGADWAGTNGCATGESGPLHLDLGQETLCSRFDPDHLRRVLVNLLDNAWRHCSGQSHAVWVRLAPRGRAAVLLSVASDGQPIAPDVEPYLFEPFFSTRSRGSGLGLYICRELCERYGAGIEFQPRGPGARHRNVFVITLSRVSSPA
ncbi:two-component system sensor histidine kinase PilS (NtrC family) [Sphaerotilus hippei]|uniref:histidine kinase n=1 Tax=Sphaerotilus hippei TaxID=744406 RepID=A0A318GZV0_9BURK|nr:two-component system sensor histidine kinase PilS (NtrC family) [Sphaerotilus hippei]